MGGTTARMPGGGAAVLKGGGVFPLGRQPFPLCGCVVLCRIRRRSVASATLEAAVVLPVVVPLLLWSRVQAPRASFGPGRPAGLDQRAEGGVVAVGRGVVLAAGQSLWSRRPPMWCCCFKLYKCWRYGTLLPIRCSFFLLSSIVLCSYACSYLLV